MLCAPGIASRPGNGKAVPPISSAKPVIVLGFIHSVSRLASIRRTLVAVAVGGADAVQSSSTTFLRASFICHPVIDRVVVSKLIDFCLPATLNLP